MKKFFQEFKEFAMRGNVLDMAVGVVVGSAFTAIVTSIVQNLLTPLLGLLIPDSTFAEWAPGGFGIGAVINSIISFLITAFVVFVLVKAVNRLTAKKKKEEEPKPEPPKGPTTEELQSAKSAISQLGGQLEGCEDYTIPGTDVTHRVVRIRKVRPTPKTFPRAFAKIKKNPLR